MDDQQHIGEYRVIQKIGAGGMGKVYLAVHRDVPSLKVVLKTLTDSRLADRFRQEADKLALLDGHPNICRIKHFFQYGEDLVIAMEYIEGITLDKKYELEGQPSINEAVKMVCETLDILEFAHGKGVAHRDIKPSNIMIDKAGRIKIIDFGIAKAETDPNLTMAGAGLGTPAYMAPEQFAPTPDTNFAIADIYAAGTCLYFLLTGKLPFKGDNEFAMRDAKLFSKPARPREFNPQISKKLENIILRSLEPEPEKRFSSALEMRKALEDVMKDLPESMPLPDETIALSEDHRTPMPTPRPPGKRNMVPIIGGAAVVVILAIVVVWLLSGGEEKGVKAPLPSSPAEGTVISDPAQFSFSWSPSNVNGATYLLEITGATGETVYFRRSTGSTALKMDTTMNNGDYAWRVRAVAGTDSSAFSDPLKFTLALPPPVVPRGVVSVKISEPSDLYIDGNLWQRDTRQAQAPFDTGQHIIQVENADASPTTIIDTISVLEGQTLPLSYQMNLKSSPPPNPPPVQPKVGRLRIASVPRGSEIILNGDETGQVTTFTFNDLKPGTYNVRLLPLEGSSANIFDTTVTVVQDSLVIMVHEF